ncbi:hypothetical protein Fmac_025201 [Flemingia macrophylla]|uniref:Uncharacterized protein n=1 Tax=Flemingia macrophylla TaxID=520843 RepID=A0ABD1LRJ0_9FABA
MENSMRFSSLWDRVFLQKGGISRFTEEECNNKGLFWVSLMIVKFSSYSHFLHIIISYSPEKGNKEI